ncbi:hypothetical protein A4A49_00208 [Nicotiana attenuata]|uniref:Uncharacterized protein n=1 Tax=Nicotiana attenuata TaxID=49451 RepID=A0A1J6IH66_NICAT|nr:hypothetical protein A4A49_00208 [Nicotiana attenuata]
MRCTKWNPWWKPEEETPITVAWINFPELPPNFFGKVFVFFLERVVGNPLHVDLATQNGTRPSCAKVKVAINLLAKPTQRIKIVDAEDEFGPKESKWIKIKYNYMPKYCNTCKKQGHIELDCGVVHPKLHRKFDEVDESSKHKELVDTATKTTKVLTSRKALGSLFLILQSKNGCNEERINIKEIREGLGKESKEHGIENMEEAQQQANQPTGGHKGSLEQAKITSGSAVKASGKKNTNRTLNPRGTVQVFDNSGGGPGGDFGWVMQKALRAIEHNSKGLKEANMMTQGTGQTMQLQLNVPLKTPLQTMHDSVTHNVTPLEIQKALINQQQFEEEGDNESTLGNFKQVAREADLLPRASAK